MNTLFRASVVLALGVQALVWPGMPQAAQEGKVAYLTGGIAVSGREKLVASEKQFNFKVVTAMEKSGQYLAGAKIKVLDAKGVAALEATLDGPWLLTRLAPGRYVVYATYGDETITKTVAIPKAGRREAYFYWSLPNEIDLVRAPEAPPVPWAPRASASR